MHYFCSSRHFFLNSFDTPMVRPTISRVPQVKILLLIFSLFISLLLRLGALALVSILAWFRPFGIFVRLLSFPSLKFQHFLKTLAQTHFPVFFIPVVFNAILFSPISPFPYPHTAHLYPQDPNLIPSGGQAPQGPRVTQMKQGSDPADVTGQLLFHSAAGVHIQISGAKGT